MAKRAKRSDRPNPRSDRNMNNFVNRQDDNNVINFNQYKRKRIDIIPRNISQEEYLVSLVDENIDIVCAIGPAGCGKTMLATLFAFKQLRAGAVDKIVIARPNIAVDDKDIGFLPGGINEKMAPWMMPILDVLYEYSSKKEVSHMLEEGIIEMVPLAYIRGRTFKNAFIILDEAQNTTKNSMLSALTRIGEGSKLIVTGDLDQSDRGTDNGLSDFAERCKRGATKRIQVIEFGHKDIERHPVCQEVLNLYK